MKGSLPTPLEPLPVEEYVTYGDLRKAIRGELSKEQKEKILLLLSGRKWTDQVCFWSERDGSYFIETPVLEIDGLGRTYTHYVRAVG
jgi:hypothetical protein